MVGLEIPLVPNLIGSVHFSLKHRMKFKDQFSRSDVMLDTGNGMAKFVQIQFLHKFNRLEQLCFSGIGINVGPLIFCRVYKKLF